MKRLRDWLGLADGLNDEQADIAVVCFVALSAMFIVSALAPEVTP